jgi:hypothetical protein
MSVDRLPRQNRFLSSLSRRRILTGVGSLIGGAIVTRVGSGFMYGLIGEVPDPLLELSQAFGRATRELGLRAITPDPEQTERSGKFLELREEVVKAGGIDKVFPVPKFPEEGMKTIDWILRREITGLASPVNRFNAETSLTTNGEYGLHGVGPYVQVDTIINNQRKRVLGMGMNSRFGDKVDYESVSLTAKTSEFAYLNLLATGARRSVATHKMDFPFQNLPITTPEGILPLMLSGIYSSVYGFNIDSLRVLGKLVENISVQKTSETSLRFVFEKEVPVYGKSMDYSSELVKNHYSQPWYHFNPISPEFNAKTPIISALNNRGGQVLLPQVFDDMAEYYRNQAEQIIMTEGQKADNELLYKDPKKLPPDTLPTIYHPAAFYVTEDRDVIRSLARVHYLHIPGQTLMIVSRDISTQTGA